MTGVQTCALPISDRVVAYAQVGAIITHLRVRDYSIGPAAAFLLLAVAALVLGLAS